jgi:hypothetical protein
MERLQVLQKFLARARFIAHMHLQALYFKHRHDRRLQV